MSGSRCYSNMVGRIELVEDDETPKCLTDIFDTENDDPDNIPYD